LAEASSFYEVTQIYQGKSANKLSEIDFGEKINMRRLLAILTSLSFLFTGIGMNPAAADASFSCGSYGTYNVTSAGVLTYGYCDADSLVLDSSVTSIQYAAMQGWRIKSLTIPASVTTIGNSAFYAMPNLETITVNASNTNFKTVNGVLMNFAETRILQYPGASRSTTYTVPGSVTRIDDRSLNCLSYLQIVNISATTTDIGPSAFETCGYATPSLKEINVSASNPQYSSIAGVLFSKDGTTLLNFPGNYAQPDYAVPAGTVTISYSAFANTKIRSVTFPNTLVNIRSYAFQSTADLISVGEFPASYQYSSGNYSPFFGAVNVESFSVAGANTHFTSVDGVMFSKDKSAIREYPGGKRTTSYRIPDSVTAVDGQAFVNSYLKTLTVPTTLQNLGYSYISLDYLIFEGNSSVTTVQGFNSVQNFIYCGSANSAITARATAMSKTVVCDASYFSSAPGSPVIGLATATNSTTASITFTAPASNGGAAIETYTATSSPGSLTGRIAGPGSGTITVTGLTSSTSYTFTITATNAVGTSSASAASASITMLPSAAELASQAAQIAAQRQAAINNARKEILRLIKLGNPITLSLLNSAEIYGGTEKSISLINADIAGLTNAAKESISSVEKIVFKFLIIDRIARGERVYLPDLQSAGLVKPNSIHNKSIPSALRRAALSQVSTFEAIQSYIAEIEKALDDRKARLLASRARVAAMLARRISG